MTCVAPDIDLPLDNPTDGPATAYSLIPVDRPASMDDMVELYSPVVTYWAMRARTGVLRSIEDIIQDGNIGLVMAWKHFQPDRGCTFKTFAVQMVRQWVFSNGIRESNPNRYNAWRTNYQGVMPCYTYIDDLSTRHVQDHDYVLEIPDEPPNDGDPELEVGSLLDMLGDDRLRTIVEQYHFGGMTLKEIGLGMANARTGDGYLSRERVRQLLERAYDVIRLRAGDRVRAKSRSVPPPNAISRAGLSRALGVSERTVRRYISLRGRPWVEAKAREAMELAPVESPADMARRVGSTRERVHALLGRVNGVRFIRLGHVIRIPLAEERAIREALGK